MQQTILVTGGTKGIGRAICETFASQNFNIITCARQPRDLEAMKNDFLSAFPSIKLYAFQADLSDKIQTLDFIDKVKNLSTEIDVLVNNTGVFLPGQIHNEEEGALEKMIETNLYSAYRVTRGLLPILMTSKNSHIFNICSTASITPYINGGSYCISKFALYGMTKVLREEMKEYGIKVTAVLPGATYTSSWEGVDLPVERFIESKDIAESVYAISMLSPRANVEEILIRPQLGDI